VTTPTSPRRGRPTASERLERRQRILTEALPVLLAHGYHRTTIEQLARAAGVSKRTIYTDYGDKAGLFTAMVRQLAHDINHAITDQNSTGEDDLASLATRIIYRVYSDELVGLHRMVIGESSRFPELARMFYEDADQYHVEALREHLIAERGPAAGDQASMLFSMLLGDSHRRRLLGVSPAPSRREAAAMARIALERTAAML
jgi:AcrR family transcriptional regulator